MHLQSREVGQPREMTLKWVRSIYSLGVFFSFLFSFYNAVNNLVTRWPL